MNLYHAASIYPKCYLFLKKVDSSVFQWFIMNPSLDQEEETLCKAETPIKAIQAAQKHWDEHYFRLLHCGFRYSLPERDEVGCNAFFWQMARSYSTFNGHYLDEEAGHLCYVDFASQEALSIWRKLR